MYDKLVRTTLRYTPVILDHHVPYKTLPNGRLCVLCQSLIPQELTLTHCQSKAPTQTQKLKTLQKLITSFFHNVIHITSQLSDPELLKMAVTESTKILPYVINSRKSIKLYLKVTFIYFFSIHSSVSHARVRRAWTCGPQRTTAYELLRFVPYTGSRLHLTNLF